MQPDKRLIQARFRESIDQFVLNGHQPGGFLTAVLSNNLAEAVARGDDAALANLPHIVAYLYNDVPSGAWGSPMAVAEWHERIHARKRPALVGSGPDVEDMWR